MLQAVTGRGDSQVRGSLEDLLEQSATVVRGSASLGAVITARIDRLRPSQQLTLKVYACVAAVYVATSRDSETGMQC